MPGSHGSSFGLVLTLGRRAADVARRLRRRFRALRHYEPRTPAEIVRCCWAELERRLAQTGHERPLGMTIRKHLTSMVAPPAVAAPSGLSSGTHASCG